MVPASPRGALGHGAIGLSWLVSVLWLLSCDLQVLPWWGLTSAIVLRTLLQTGLFILAHDAMHGLLCRGNPAWNHRLGALFLTLYAFLPYRLCRRLHQRHHQAPGSALDPDGPPSHNASIWRWYVGFMATYLSPRQMTALLLSWLCLALVGGPLTPTSLLNVLTFCTLPLLLSSWQLFLFGTYLPHRRQRPPQANPHPDSLDLPPWLSLLACFHFGYHRAHHDNPGLSWFQLPAAHQSAGALAITATSR